MEDDARRHGQEAVAAVQTLDLDAVLGLAAPIEVGVCDCEALCVCEDDG